MRWCTVGGRGYVSWMILDNRGDTVRQRDGRRFVAKGILAMQVDVMPGHRGHLFQEGGPRRVTVGFLECDGV